MTSYTHDARIVLFFDKNDQTKGGLMWCPKCDAEYRDGFFHCNTCNVDLVEANPKQGIEASPEYIKKTS